MATYTTSKEQRKAHDHARRGSLVAGWLYGSPYGDMAHYQATRVLIIISQYQTSDNQTSVSHMSFIIQANKLSGRLLISRSHACPSSIRSFSRQARGYWAGKQQKYSYIYIISFSSFNLIFCSYLLIITSFTLK